MRLAVQTDLSMRLLIYLAVRPDGLATIAQVAAAYRISRNHMMKVAHRLGLEGWVETVRGRKGGLRLARAPQAITLGEVVRLIEPDLAYVPCFAPVDAWCAIVPACGLRGAMEEARSAFLRVLDGYTLEDLVKSRAALSRLLQTDRAQNPGDNRPILVRGSKSAAWRSRSLRRAVS